MHDFLYTPQQPGYEKAGQGYQMAPVNGKAISQCFDVENPQTVSIPVIPDGCHDLLFIFDGNRVESYVSLSVSQPYAFQFSKAQWIFGVRFLPGAMHSFSSIYEKGENDNILWAADLFPGIRAVENQLCDSVTFLERQEKLFSYLQGVYKEDEKSRLLSYSVQSLLQSEGQRLIETLAQKTGYTSRYLRQLFHRYVGHSPKELGNLIRVQRTIVQLKNRKEEPLSQVAVSCGFSDQSHMNRELKKYTRQTAEAIRENQTISFSSLPERKFGN